MTRRASKGRRPRPAGTRSGTLTLLEREGRLGAVRAPPSPQVPPVLDSSWAIRNASVPCGSSTCAAPRCRRRRGPAATTETGASSSTSRPLVLEVAGRGVEVRCLHAVGDPVRRAARRRTLPGRRSSLGRCSRRCRSRRPVVLRPPSASSWSRSTATLSAYWPCGDAKVADRAASSSSRSAGPAGASVAGRRTAHHVYSPGTITDCGWVTDHPVRPRQAAGAATIALVWSTPRSPSAYLDDGAVLDTCTKQQVADIVERPERCVIVGAERLQRVAPPRARRTSPA